MRNLKKKHEATPLRGLASSAAVRMAMAAAAQPLLALASPDCCVLAYNDPALSLLADNAADLTGLDFRQFLADEGERCAFEKRLDDLSDPPVEFTLRLAARGGAERDCRACLLPVAGCDCEAERGAALIRLEPEQQKKARRAADSGDRASNYAALLEKLMDGYLELDEDWRVAVANKSAQAMLARGEKVLRGLCLDQVFPTLSAENIAELLGEQGGQILAPMLIKDQARQFEIRAHRQPSGVGVLFRDVTDSLRQQFEISKLNMTMAASQELLRSKNDELRVSLAQLEKLNEQLTEADQLKAEFLANTSHELRTPLNAIIGFLQLIDEGLCENQEEMENYIRNSLSSAKNLLTLINDLLDIAKIEAGQMNFLIENHDVDEILQEVYSRSCVAARQKELEFNYELRGAARLSIRADLHKTMQVLENLAGNGVKFTDAGGVTMWAEPDPANSDMIRFAVQDTGIGVPLEQQAHMFEKFRQGDGSATRRHQGTGLGLAITKNLVEMMGGGIWMKSEGEGHGTTVFFTLPRAADAPQSPVQDLTDADLEEFLPDTF